MSKLYKLRRDILKNPNRYRNGYGAFVYHNKKTNTYTIRVSIWTNGYEKFIASVLKERK